MTCYSVPLLMDGCMGLDTRPSPAVSTPSVRGQAVRRFRRGRILEGRTGMPRATCFTRANTFVKIHGQRKARVTGPKAGSNAKLVGPAVLRASGVARGPASARPHTLGPPCRHANSAARGHAWMGRSPLSRLREIWASRRLVLVRVSGDEIGARSRRRGTLSEEL